MLVLVFELLDVLEEVGVGRGWQPKVRHLDGGLLGHSRLVLLGVVGQFLDRLASHALALDLVNHSAEASVCGVVWLDHVEGIPLDGDPRQDGDVVLRLRREVWRSQPIDGLGSVDCEGFVTGVLLLKVTRLLTRDNWGSWAFDNLPSRCAHGRYRILSDRDGEGFQNQRESRRPVLLRGPYAPSGQQSLLQARVQAALERDAVEGEGLPPAERRGLLLLKVRGVSKTLTL